MFSAPLTCAPGDERHDDQRLRLVRGRSGNDVDARVEVRIVRRAAARGSRPPSPVMPSPNASGRLHDLGRPAVAREPRHEQAAGLVGPGRSSACRTGRGRETASKMPSSRSSSPCSERRSWKTSASRRYGDAAVSSAGRSLPGARRGPVPGKPEQAGRAARLGHGGVLHTVRARGSIVRTATALNSYAGGDARGSHDRP